MKSKSLVFLTLLILASTVAAKDPEFQRGILLSVDSSACNAPDNFPTAASQRKKARDFQCQEYILQGEHFIYRLRPVNEKHPTLMTTGEIAQFRVNKNRLIMITPESDSREREYEIVAATPRPDRPTPTQSASKE
jgi:hypothetical protein